MNTTDISIFRREGVDIRVLTIGGEPWWVVADLARALGLSNPSMAAGRLPIGDLSRAEVTDALGRKQSARITTEAGMYRLIFESRRPEAEDFQRWVTHEVLPSIRRSGSYALEQRALPTDFVSALRELANEVEAHEVTRAQLAEVQPRADAWNAIASADGDYSVGDAAKILARRGIPTGPQRLFAQLEEIKWIYRGGDGKWRPYAERVEKGFLAEKAQFHHHPGSGDLVLDAPQVRVTVKGIEKLRQRLHVGALQAVTA